MCRLGKARNFNELSPIIPSYKAQKLQQVYEHVDDIDLFVGGIHEQPVEGGINTIVYTLWNFIEGGLIL